MSELARRGLKGEAEIAPFGCFRLEPGAPHPLVQACTPRAAREQGARFVLKFESAHAAPKNVPERSLFPPLLAPAVDQPGRKDWSSHQHQVNQHKVAQADADHLAPGSGGGTAAGAAGARP